jgi:hypothetical protein
VLHSVFREGDPPDRLGWAKVEDPVIAAAQKAFKGRLRTGCYVSEHTRNAQLIGKVWEAEVHAIDPDRYRTQSLVRPGFDQRIDVLDTQSNTAYEFKVSGKNAIFEFYKDVVKVLLWNEKGAEPKPKITHFVFITEEECGGKSLDKPMPRSYVQHLQETYGLAVEICFVRHLKDDSTTFNQGR